MLPRALRNGAGARFPVEPEVPRKVLVSFVGKNHIGFYNSSTVRPDLLAAYEKWSGDKQRVVVNGLLHRSDRMSKVEYQKLLWESEFGLLPRGDERHATPCGPHCGDGVEISGSAQVELALRGDDERGACVWKSKFSRRVRRDACSMAW